MNDLSLGTDAQREERRDSFVCGYFIWLVYYLNWYERKKTIPSTISFCVILESLCRWKMESMGSDSRYSGRKLGVYGAL